MSGMGSDLSWVAVALSGAALAHELLHARRLPPAGVPAWRPLILPLAGALGALTALFGPLKGFSGGEAAGLLMGAAAVLLATAAGPSVPGTDGRSWFAAATGCAAAPALGLSLLLALSPGRFPALADGFALGAVAAGLAAAGGLWLAGQSPRRGSEAGTAGVELAVLTAAGLAAATSLASRHLSPSGGHEWLPLPVLFLSVLAAGLALRTALTSPKDEARGRSAVREGLLTLGAVLVPPAAMAWLIGFRLHGSAGFFSTTLLGLAAFGLTAWLDGLLNHPARPFGSVPAGTGGQAARGTPSRGTPSRGTQRADVGLAAALLLLGAAALVFRELHGYGLGVAVLAGSAVAAASPGEHPARPGEGYLARPLVRGGLTLLLLLALYRVFEEKNDYGRSLEPDFFYYYAALVAGALLPALLSVRAGVGRAPAGTAVSRLKIAVLQLGLTAAAAAAAPLTLWMLLGPRPQAAFLVGLAVGAGFRMSSAGLRPVWVEQGLPDDRAPPLRGYPLAGLLSLLMALSAALFTPFLEPLGLWTRWHRILLLAALAAIALAWAGILTRMEGGEAAGERHST